MGFFRSLRTKKIENTGGWRQALFQSPPLSPRAPASQAIKAGGGNQFRKKLVVQSTSTQSKTNKLQQACRHLAADLINKPTTGCVSTPCDSLLTTSLFQDVSRFFSVDCQNFGDYFVRSPVFRPLRNCTYKNGLPGYLYPP